VSSSQIKTNYSSRLLKSAKPLNDNNQLKFKLPKIINDSTESFDLKTKRTSFFISNNESLLSQNDDTSNKSSNFKRCLLSRASQSHVSRKDLSTSNLNNASTVNYTPHNNYNISSHHLVEKGNIKSDAQSRNSQRIERLFAGLFDTQTVTSDTKSSVQLTNRETKPSNSNVQVQNLSSASNTIFKTAGNSSLVTESKISLATTAITTTTITKREDLWLNLKFDEDFDENDETIRHDLETLKCLNVSFQPWFTSTHGLSRANSPDLSSESRYNLILDDCILESMLTNLTCEQIEHIKFRVNKDDLIAMRSKLCEDYLNDVHKHYIWSMKKSIVDYILREEEEQKRLGIKIQHKVFFILHLI
jgi:hypothetical protein